MKGPGEDSKGAESIGAVRLLLDLCPGLTALGLSRRPELNDLDASNSSMIRSFCAWEELQTDNTSARMMLLRKAWDSPVAKTAQMRTTYDWTLAIIWYTRESGSMADKITNATKMGTRQTWDQNPRIGLVDIIPGKTKLVTETQKRRRSLSTTDAANIFSQKTSNRCDPSLLGLLARLDLLKKSMDVLSFTRKAPVAYLVPS